MPEPVTAIEQRRRKAVGDGDAQSVSRGLLRGREFGGGEIWVGPTRRPARRGITSVYPACPRRSAVNDAGRDAGQFGRFALAGARPVRQQRQHAVARRRHAPGCRAREPHATRSRAGPRWSPMRRHIRSHHAARTERVGRHPVDELAHSAFSGGMSSFSRHPSCGCQARVGMEILPPTPRRRERGPTGNAHHIAGFKRHAFGHR